MSNVRQTRSMAKAAKTNLEKVDINERGEGRYDPSFVPSMVDDVEGEVFDCAYCDRPNTAEWYMVQCKECEHWYHFSCAKVSTTSVNKAAFSCVLCVPRISVPAIRSDTSRITSSSARKARIDRELERLEEERRLMDELCQEKLAQEQALLEKATLEKLERMKLYIARKYDLRSQQDGNDEHSEGSYRTNRTSTSRVGVWVESQRKITEFAAADPTLPTMVSPVDTRNVKFTSTPLAESASVGKMGVHSLLSGDIATVSNMNSLIRTTGSITIGENLEDDSDGIVGIEDKSYHDLISPILPSVSVQPLITLLEDARAGPSNVGTVPKLAKSVPTYDHWRQETGALRLQELHHNKENEVRRKRELALVEQVKQLEMQRAQDLHEQQRKEAEFKQQLQILKQDHAAAELQRQQQIASWDSELQRLRKSEQDFMYQMEVLRQREQAKETRDALVFQSQSHLVTEAMRSKESVCSKQQQSQRENLRPLHGNHMKISGDIYSDVAASVSAGTYQASHTPVVDYRPSYSNNRVNETTIVSSPVGGRTDLAFSTPSLAPAPQVFQTSALYAPVQTQYAPTANPYTKNQLQLVSIGPTPQQLAARHVVSKELPVFTGDPVDWPLFISSYQHSTHACGYSDSENLLRLQRCLKGSAKEAVSSFLLHPSTVSQIISTLQMLYGRPEQIVQNMIAKVRATPAPKADRLDMLVSFGLVVQNLCGHLKAVGLDNHLANPVLLQELIEKLPPAVKFNWALYQQQIPIVDLNIFNDYMAKVASAASSVTLMSGTTTKPLRDEHKGKEKAYVNAHSSERIQHEDIENDNRDNENPPLVSTTPAPTTTRRTESCPACGGWSHLASNCATFNKLCVDERWKIVKDRKLCRRCLTPHIRWPCKGEVCGVNGCQKRHHRLLHYEQSPADSEMSRSNVNATVTIHRQMTSSTLFRVLPVTLFGRKGNVHTYAFLDDGSSVTLLEQSIADSLGLEGKTEPLCIQWTGGINKKMSGARRVSLEISGAGSEKLFNVAEVYTVDNLGLPEQTLEFGEMERQYDHLRGLPVSSFKSAVPRMLIGLNNTHLLATLKLREGRPLEPIATKTRIGWAVYGNLREDTESFQHRQMHICARSDDQLHDYVRQFFSVESMGVTVAPSIEGIEDQRARKILEETTVRTASGRFETGLLWKHDHVEFPDSRPMAEKRLRCLEKRLSKNPELYENVRQQIVDFQQKGYAHKATSDELASFDTNRTWYLPLGIVLNPKKPGKVRLIWDAAAKVKGVSLNTMLLKGPDLLTPLLSVLYRYREREVAICGDIKEMFHQILIREKDRSAQLFLWRNTPDLPMETMVTDVAIFGATCSPVQSQYVKNFNATENEKAYPKAADAIKKRHYVDDYLESLDTIEEAVGLALEVSEVHAKAGFQIRNWISNHEVVLKRIGEVNPTAVKCFVADKEVASERLLGLVWLPNEDVFSFTLNLRDDVRRLVQGEVIPTKRELLRVVMSIYDPLGLVAAFVIHGKVIVQDVWRANVGWDETIPDEVFCRWEQWLTVLRNMENIKIPRCYFPGYDINSLDSLELHIFVDASEQAFAAVAYFRMLDRGRVRCALVSSKTKVAPLQPLSIPRLELLAAVLGARLRKSIEEGHSFKIKRTYFWTDSTTVRSWIKSDLRRYRPYVAFRVNEILSLSKVDEWRWVPTRLNVADEATKWGRGPSFEPASRWYKAPEYIHDENHEWPKDPVDIGEASEELRPAYLLAHLILKPIVDFERFSKWERLHRCVAYVHRFVDNCRRANSKIPLETAGLTKEELQKAERSLWRLAQSDEFPDEVATLKRNLRVRNEDRKPLEKSSKIATATPAMDEFGILRVDGRSEKAECLTYDAKYPVILPKEHRMTRLLLDWYHRIYRHANNETIVNEVKQRFYVPRLRVQIDAILTTVYVCGN
ncbi:uncharacterized protein LOC131686058 [Topomyia yanbarensis]|uniref:uncharacterized protein LOC131686058 n=1 Tax=Topomyia yanbarensis TaxID=2498891 RepID=UPI00273B425C|nr:uncharacterized protein LOC131686058 [Topomyia yanbarensis]